MSVPPFEMSPAVIAALRRASAMLSEAQPRLAPYRAQTKRLGDAYGMTISEDTLNDFAKKDTSPRDLERLARALWAYLSAEFPAIFKAAWREVQLEAIGLRDPFAAALHYFYMGGRASDAETLTALSGDFAVYRPHFAELDTVMVMALRCGADDQPSRFEATMSYEAEDGHPVVDRVEGVMLPYHGSVLFQGRMIGTIAPFVFVLTNFARSDGRIRSGAGAVMVATSGAFPTASGLVAIRRSEPPLSRTLSVREAADTIAEWKLVRSALDRGFVKWR
jgi:hypothetical protein